MPSRVCSAVLLQVPGHVYSQCTHSAQVRPRLGPSAAIGAVPLAHASRPALLLSGQYKTSCCALLTRQKHPCTDMPAMQFCGQFKQPLCLALLRNCVSPYDEAFSAATKLFAAVLMLPKLRSGLKAELGAFLNLLLLRPLETDK